MKGSVAFQQITTCTACGGHGTIIESPCPTCNGSGQTLEQQEIKVKIPPGVEEATELRIPGHGLPSTHAGAPPGDLYVVVRTLPDARFERRGADLWHAETLEVADAVLGTTLTIPTLDGAVTVEVPPGTQPGFVLRLRGKGLPRFGRDRKGDLFLALSVHIPERLSGQERKLFEELRSQTKTPSPHAKRLSRKKRSRTKR
jgi:molecular chaperone DnaJ